MVLGRRDFLHGVLAMPASSMLAQRARPAADVTVANGCDLQAALRAACPGSTITLAPGDFGDVAMFELAAPDITVRASVPLRSVLRAPLDVGGERTRLQDLAFWGEEDTGIYMAAVAACTDSVSIRASDVELRGCDFGYFVGRAVMVRPSGMRPYIHDCTFHDNRLNRASSNANEGIALGYDAANQHVQMRARVYNNRFWNMNVEGEVLSVKTSNNTIQGNQVSNSRGGITNRMGQGSTFQNNVTTNSRGIAIGGRDVRLIGNRIVGTGILAVQAGNSAPDSMRNADHPQSVGAYLQGNSGRLVIGGQYRPKPAMGTNVVSHNGQIQLLLHSDTRLPGRR